VIEKTGTMNQLLKNGSYDYFFKIPILECLPFYPESNSVSTIRIRLQKVIMCFGLLNILRVRFLKFFATLWKVGKLFLNVIFLVLGIKGQLRVITLAERNFFWTLLETRGAIQRQAYQA
jgi:hypothetical protein